MEKVKKCIRYVADNFFDSKFEFRVRLFNILALSASIMCFCLIIATMLTGATFFVVSLISISLLFSVGMLIYSKKSGDYNLCSLITIIVVFFIIFPVFFFSDGGYRSGISNYFIFAIVFTVLMLDKMYAIVVSILEILLFVGMCAIAYIYPETVTLIASESRVFWDYLIAFLGSGMVCGLVVYLYMSEYEDQRIQLSVQNEQLQKYNEAKNTFLTTVAHEIKNPLTAISLNARDTMELFYEELQDEDLIQGNLETVEKIVMRIDRILSDLMDTVSIEQGRLSLSLSPLQLREVLSEAGNMLMKDANAKGNVINYNIENSPPIMADYQRLLQVVINLLSNAIKHTKNGSITLSLKNDGDYQIVSVSDTGEGIAEEIRSEVFKGYVSMSKEYWRHGIGLYISHQIVMAHHGTIDIDSEVGKGCNVFFRIPIGEC